MSIESWAENIKELAEIDIASQSRDELIASNAQAILDALKWIPVSERLPEGVKLSRVKFDDGSQGMVVYNSHHECWQGFLERPIVAWRELV